MFRLGGGDGFEETFGFRPTGRPELKKVEQGKVDEVLSTLAGRCMVACKRQVDLTEGCKKMLASCEKASFNALLQRSKAELNDIEEDVKYRKASFWGARTMAEKRGFTVPKTVRDSIPHPKEEKF